MLVTDLPVHHKIIHRLTTKGITELTDIQQQCLLPALQGKDIVASSQTGSGKTLAFLVPAIHRCLTQKALSKQDPRVLILAPTRELAKQVYLEAKSLVSQLNLSTALIVGGENFNDQVKLLRHHPHIVVGTAGRIADHIQDRSLFLQGLELLIFDEADRMMDLGFAEQLRLIHEQANHRKRQTLLFSATIGSLSVEHLSTTLLKAPVKVMVGEETSGHQDIAEVFYFSDHLSHKQEMLMHLLSSAPTDKAIVFCATREETERLAELLSAHGIDAQALHGDMPQNKRSQLMQAFSNAQTRVMVSTDVASRGLDIRHLEWVINFDLPKVPDEYIHRIGRTGRAGNKGNAISLVGPRDWEAFVALKALLTYPVDALPYPPLPATFRGRTSTNNRERTKMKRNDNPSSGSSTTSVRKKRVDAMAGDDIGILPIKRKKAPIIEVPTVLDEEE